VGGSRLDDFYVYVSHYKSGDAQTDNNGQRRGDEGQAIRADEATLPASARVIYAGDYNLFDASDPGYVAITATGQGQGFDPINSPHFHDSQTPRVTKTETASSLSSRLDLELVTQNVLSDTNGLHYVTGSYHAFGNDGSASNVSQSATALSGLANRTTILNDLVSESDHLPIVADYTDTISDPVGPTVNSFTSNPTSVNASTPSTLTANVTEAGAGSLSSVNFYRESNGTAGLQIGSDVLVGSGTRSGNNWSFSMSTTGLSGGSYTLYAVATDNSSFTDSASTTLTVIGPATPTIGGFNVSPTSVAAGRDVTLTATNVTRLGGTINNVKFYRESNGVSGLQIGSDAFVGSGTQGGSDWIVTTSTTGLQSGSTTYYAVATDSSGVSSAVASTQLTVTAPPAPVIGSFSASPTSVNVGTPTTLTAANVTETGGTAIDAVDFYLETNSTPGLQIGSDSFVTEGVENGTNWSMSVDTSALTAGAHTYYAVATDDFGVDGAAAQTTLTVTIPPQPLVHITILGSTNPSGPFSPNVQVSPGQSVYYQVLEQLAPVGTANGSKTITSLTAHPATLPPPTGYDGAGSLSFNLLESGGFGGSFATAALATNPTTGDDWTKGPGASPGTASGSSIGSVRPIQGNGIFAGAVTAEAILTGSFAVASNASAGANGSIGGAWTSGGSGSFQINSNPADGTGGSKVFITGGDPNGYVSFNPLALNVISALPAWLAPASAATWDASTHALNVTGAATIIADPGNDSPNITADGAVAQLTINPSTDNVVHIGGLTLLNGADASYVSNGNERSLVVGSPSADGTLSIDAAHQSDLDLQTNAMILNYGGASPLASVQLLLSDGYNDGLWNGSGITSSTAAANAGTALGYADASTIGSPSTFANQPVDATTLLIRYTRPGDANLDDAVDTSDFVTMANHFGQAGKSWADGNFNFDSPVNALDFNAVASNFGSAPPVLAPTVALSMSARLASAPSAIGSLFNDDWKNTSADQSW
jgi:hypothetical protein